MSLPSHRLFADSCDLDVESLAGVLHQHAMSVESVLLAADQEPGVAYTALGVLRIAASLVAIPDGPNGSRPWSLPDIGRATDFPEWRIEAADGDLPF